MTESFAPRRCRGALGGVFATELLPHPWRDVGALLPPGAGTTLVRNVSYFGGNAIVGPLLVLAAYSIVGTVITVLAGGRQAAGPWAKPRLPPRRGPRYRRLP